MIDQRSNDLQSVNDFNYIQQYFCFSSSNGALQMLHIGPLTVRLIVAHSEILNYNSLEGGLGQR